MYFKYTIIFDETTYPSQSKHSVKYFLKEIIIRMDPIAMKYNSFYFQILHLQS